MWMHKGEWCVLEIRKEFIMGGANIDGVTRGNVKENVGPLNAI